MYPRKQDKKHQLKAQFLRRYVKIDIDFFLLISKDKKQEIKGPPEQNRNNISYNLMLDIETEKILELKLKTIIK